MAKILVADDEVDLEMLIKQKFRRKIREHKYEFVFALNGKEALQRVEEHPDIDIVLTDINMPEMDGLVLLERLSERSPLIKTVIVSAYGDMENIRTAMNRGAFNSICKPVDFLELELTTEKTLHHVAEIKRTLQAIKENNILRMYVDETVLKFMNRREFETTLLSNETIEATVAFIDICCFTSISENEPADTVVNLLNKYFDMMVKEIIIHDGYVDKFMEDAIMAVFRGEYHLDRAIEACRAVRKRIDELPVDENNVNFSPKVSNGINSGEVISGNIGLADLRRLDYTVIGDVVNTAERLQSVAEEGQLITDESSYLKVKEFFNCKMVKEVVLKNKRKPVTVYEVLA